MEIWSAVVRKILRAIGKSLRRILARMRAGAAWCAGFVDGVVDGLIGGGYEPNFDDEEIVEVANDQPVEAALARDPAPSLALVVQRACACRNASRPFASLFDDRNPEHRRARSFVEALDEAGLRAVRHMPIGTLSRHLDRNDTFRATGLLDVDAVIARAKTPPVEVPAARKDRVRSATVKLILEAQQRGEPLDLASVVAARRAA